MTLVLPSLTRLPSPNFSSRGGAKVRLVVIHDCEGSYAGSVSWFAQARSQVSAHIVLRDDGAVATQMVEWADKAWAVCAYNSVSESYEAAGFAAKGLGAPEWKALAAITAFRLKALGLPPVYAKGGAGQGVCQHIDLGAAGGGHHDVTSDPEIWAQFMAMTTAAYGQDMPASWGPSAPLRAPAAPVGWTPCASPRHDLVIGSLEWTQMRLNALGAWPLLAIDGKLGPQTESAIRQFQARAGLFIDGIVGMATVAALAKGTP